MKKIRVIKPGHDFNFRVFEVVSEDNVHYVVKLSTGRNVKLFKEDCEVVDNE